MRPIAIDVPTRASGEHRVRLGGLTEPDRGTDSPHDLRTAIDVGESEQLSDFATQIPGAWCARHDIWSGGVPAELACFKRCGQTRRLDRGLLLFKRQTSVAALAPGMFHDAGRHTGSER
jgi:hypothetical protein